MRKVYKILLQIISAGALIILGLLLGLRTAQQDSLKEMQRSTVQTIAIVNMDEGIMEGEEKVYYAEQMFTYPDMDYEVTDLNDAVSGVDHGKYAAYIIIPANFSESISSINAEPSRANLEYAVNMNLRDDINEQVRRRITAFENMLNNNIEYMYLSAVLQEFHKAQDSAQIVMNNDTEDMEILMQVQPDDISESVVLENGETVPYDIGLLDLLTYYDSNAELIAGINDYYDQAQEEAEAAFQEIAEAGEQVGSDIDQLSTVMSEIDIFVDEEGNDLLAKEQETIETAITEAEENNQEVTDKIIELTESFKLPTMLYEDGEIAPVMEALQSSLNETVEKGGYQDPLLHTEEKDDQDTEADQNASGQAKSKSKSTSSQEEEQVKESEPDQEKEQEEEKEVDQEKEQEEEKEVDQEKEQEEDQKKDQEDIKADQESFQLYIAQKPQSNDKTDDQEEKDEEDEKEDLPTFPMIDVETQPFTVVRSAEVNQLRMQQIILYQLLKEKENYEPLSYDGIRESINVNLMEPMAQNQEQAIASISESQDVFLDSSTDYLTQMSEYSILDYLNIDGIYDNMDQFDENVAKMYETITEQDEQYNQYVEDVYTTTEEWKELWKTDIEEADAASLAKLDTGLASAKDSRETSNATNLLLLDELTKKLPYTRLGSLEYTTAYQFMVSPVTFTDKGGEHHYAYVSETREYDKYIMICIAILLLLTTGTALGHAVSRRKSERKGEQWNAYE